MKKLNALITTVAIMASGAVMAGSFSDYDLDKDGAISKSEAAVSEQLIKVFDDLDINKDGQLSKQEFNK
ncbi:calmodulin [Pseudoalteromonas byunsanensis]|uniref:Calmodulin n=1 Tax=Pseudoalteromonas byunsanensis TaxID=327939 RepID=A0A1S1N070_9GAMM|nr:calmodulin [Pseudoalteromonas byunsanensis]OHU94583.1 calmodulin [Pseudoalteromonas byunsanensis]